MLDIDGRETHTPQIDSKESHNHIHTVALNRRAFLNFHSPKGRLVRIPPTPYFLLRITLIDVSCKTPPGTKIKGQSKKIFAKI